MRPGGDRARDPDRAPPQQLAGGRRAGLEGTTHNYETIAAWIRRLGDHADAITHVLVHDLELSAVEIDEFCLV